LVKWHDLDCARSEVRNRTHDCVASCERSTVGSQPRIEYIETEDRRLWTLDIEPDEPFDLASLRHQPLDGAVVRLRVTLREGQSLEGRRLVEKLYEAGAHKVIGPQVVVIREERKRSDMTPEMDPKEALNRWLDANEVTGRLRERTVEEAEELMRALPAD
jgi:hypothetical protein